MMNRSAFHRRGAPWLVGMVTLAAVAALAAPPASANDGSDQQAYNYSASASTAGTPIAATPPMGYMDWSRDECYGQAPEAEMDGSTTTANYSFQQYMEDNAKALTDAGLTADGYKTMMLDDCWMGDSRSSSGQLQPNTVWGWSSGQPGFTNMTAYGQYLHSLGDKFGIYETSGTATCQGGAGSQGHEATDAATFVSWGVDELKYDNCGASNLQTDDTAMSNALQSASAAAKAPNIVFDISTPAAYGDGTGKFAVMDWVRTLGQQWRIGPDISTYSTSNGTPVDPWDQVLSGYDQGAYQEFNSAVEYSRYQSPGNWNDADELLIGDNGMTTAEERSQMALFSILASPLLISTDARKFDPGYISGLLGSGNATEIAQGQHLQNSVAILNNSGAIAVDQDPLGIGGYRVSGGAAISDPGQSDNGTPQAASGVDVVAKPLSNGSLAVVVLNKNSTTLSKQTLSLSALGLNTNASPSCTYSVKDVWGNQGWTNNTTSATSSVALAPIGTHDNAMLTLSPSSGCGGFVPTGQITAGTSGFAGAALCLDASATTSIDLAGCAGTASQQWRMEPNGTVQLIQAGANNATLCLTANSSTSTINGNTSQWAYAATCGSQPGYQNWSYDRDGNLALSGTTASAGKCLHAYSGSVGTVGTLADVAACGAAPDAISTSTTWSAPLGATTIEPDVSGKIAGGAGVASCSACADGKLVGYIGEGGTLTLNNVTVPSAGAYQVQIQYIDADAGRTADITVDGATTPVAFHGSDNGNWGQTQSAVVTLGLNAGTNTIEFSNPTAYAPSISTVSVPALPSGTLYEADTQATLGGAAVVQSCGCVDGHDVGYLGNGGTLTFNVNEQTAGTYQLRVSYVNGDSGSRTADVTVNGGTANAVPFPTDGSWSTLQDITIPVTLKAGSNTIQFGNPSGWVASISTITV